MATLNITSVTQLEYLWKVIVDIEAESRTTCLPQCPGYPSSPMCPAAIDTTDVYRANLQ